MIRNALNSVTFKVVVLLFLTLLLMIPLAHIGSVIDERGESQQSAANELARTYAGPQTLAGPVLYIPYTERWLEKGAPRSAERGHYIFPSTLDVTGTMEPQERYRGIFKILFYAFDGKASGQLPGFRAAELSRMESNSKLDIGTPVLVVGVGDIRGVEGTPALQLADTVLRFGQPSAQVAPQLGKAIHAPLEGMALEAFRRGDAMQFTLNLRLVGQERLSIVPLAGETTAHIQSPWAHPSFGGSFLASQRTVSESGFDARWKISSLATAAQSQLLSDKKNAAESAEHFGVTLMQPLNVYALTDRAVKYGFLFIAVTLLATFLFEMFRHLRLHPIQYGLVGFSIALFFLLLLALSEKLPFAVAYGLSAGTSVVLLGVYFSAVLGGASRGATLAGFVAILYAALYGLLSSEDNALLLGSLLIFGMVAGLMLLTRKVDWYALGSTGT